MPGDTVSRARALAEKVAVEAAWTQWTALTAAAAPVEERRAWTIVDPEALVLASLALGSRERRLEDFVAAWARAAAFLMSKPRFRSLSALFPQGEAGVARFARYAAEAGDSSWKRMAPSDDRDAAPTRRKELGALKLVEGPSLVLRLRAGFGVNAKADVLALLLGLGGTAASLKVIAAATGYTERMIRTATEEMVLAGFIHEIRGRPSSFHVDPRPWAHLLQIYRLEPPDEHPSIPPWQFWSAIFSFLLDVSRWATEAQRQEWTDYVASSRARDLYEEHERRLGQAGLKVPPHETDRGVRYLETFAGIVKQVAERTVDKLYA